MIQQADIPVSLLIFNGTRLVPFDILLVFNREARLNRLSLRREQMENKMYQLKIQFMHSRPEMNASKDKCVFALRMYIMTDSTIARLSWRYNIMRMANKALPQSYSEGVILKGKSKL